MYCSVGAGVGLEDWCVKRDVNDTMKDFEVDFGTSVVLIMGSSEWMDYMNCLETSCLF